MSEHVPAAEASGPAGAEKRVSWAELFFDLVFVFAVTQVSTLLGSDHGPGGLARAIVVFVPIYWMWVGTSIRANTRDLTPRRQLALFAIALAGLVMALAVPDAYRDRALLFAAAYWAARLVLGSGLFTGTRFVFNVFTVSMAITGPLLVVGALLHGRGQQWLWASAAVVDLATPWVLRSQTRRIRVDAAHLAERFGLFVLIALGESVVAIGAPVAASHRLVGACALAAVAVAFTVCCGLWWVYFNTTADEVREALAAAQVQADLIREVLSYGHLLFIASIISAAVGLGETVAHPSGSSWGVAGLLFGGCALYLATFGYTRWRTSRQLAITRLTTAGVLLLLAALVPALAAATVLAAAIVGLNITDQQLRRRASPHQAASGTAHPNHARESAAAQQPKRVPVDHPQ